MSIRSIVRDVVGVTLATALFAALGLVFVVSQHAYIHSGAALVRMTPETLGSGAMAVVRGVVRAQSTQATAFGVVTLTTLDVTSVYKGAITPGPVIIRTRGGAAGSVVEHADDQATFMRSREVIVFLFAQPDALEVLGGFQGRYFLDGNGASNETGSVSISTLIRAAQRP